MQAARNHPVSALLVQLVLPKPSEARLGGVRVPPPAPEKRTPYEASHKEVIVGATIGRPRAFDERPYKQISAEILFSLPICGIMGYIVGRGLAPAVTKDLSQ